MLKPNPRQTAVRASEQHRIFRSANLEYNYRPFRGLLFSLLAHASLLSGVLFFPISAKVSERSRYLARAVIIDHNKMVLYLPAIGDRPHKRETSAPESGDFEAAFAAAEHRPGSGRRARSRGQVSGTFAETTRAAKAGGAVESGSSNSDFSGAGKGAGLAEFSRANSDAGGC